MTSYDWLIKNAQILIQYYLWKYSRSYLQTWHHQSKSKGEQNHTCHAVAMTTVLLLVFLKYKLKIPYCFTTKIIYTKNISRNLFDNVGGTSVSIGTLSLTLWGVAIWNICFLDGTHHICKTVMVTFELYNSSECKCRTVYAVKRRLIWGDTHSQFIEFFRYYRDLSLACLAIWFCSSTNRASKVG